MTAPLRSWLRYLLALCCHYSGLDWLYRHVSGAGLVILMLHRVRDEPDPYPLSMSRGNLRQIIRWLRGQQALVGLGEGLRDLSPAAPQRVRYALTFDDGYHDNLGLIDASLGRVPAVVYVATGHIGGEPIWAYRLAHAIESRSRDQVDLGGLGMGHFDLAEPDDRYRLYALLPARLKELEPAELEAWVDHLCEQTKPRPIPHENREMLDWDDVRKLYVNGVEIGGHTCSHAILSRLDETAAREEIGLAHASITTELGMPPRHFAYPNGGSQDFGDRDARLVREAGFETATTSIEGINRPGADPYRLMRFNVHEQRFLAPSGRLSRALFFSETSGLLGWLRGCRGAVESLPDHSVQPG
ncbi:polysaccharide deacetylase family protein [Lysobacter arenosi]|jgi:peptidoglycan/xylan/chitin deacetylase (PgdA/CDA1 family)|uniref:Polysaccharide deacetylase family protein n=1 Tax=Lysobacter arenosi TaxID=2795387 RepID=A0ABX7RDK6_9GAMM|nr:polysaccharide deacetylase family protein [Lysobacter arenosi]QSX75482.1 polysaccharide deacetylase family protein [Lysobacter arenosi]